MRKSIITSLLFISLATSHAIAECSKKELVQFIELGFSKEEIKQICKDDSITFSKFEDKESDSREFDDEATDTETSNIEDEKEDESDSTVVETPKSAFQQVRSSTRNTRNQIILEIGGMNGEYTLTSNDDILREYSGALDHQLSGGIFLISYQYKFESNLIFGVGYQAFNLEGESDSVKRSFSYGGVFFTDYGVKIKTDEFQGNGLVGIIGYEFNISDSLEITPQLRIGVSNEITVTQTAYTSGNFIGANTSTRSTDSDTITPIGLSIPIVYRFGSFGLGLSLYSLAAGVEDEINSSKAEITTTAGGQIFLGNKF